MKSKVISICTAALAGVMASIAITVFSTRVSADEGSTLSAGSASESMAESVCSSCTDVSVVSSEASSTIKVSENLEDSKVDSSSSKVVSSRTEDSSREPKYPTVTVTKGGITGTEASPQSNTPSSTVVIVPHVAIPGVDGARPVANDTN